MRQELILVPFKRWRNWGLQSLITHSRLRTWQGEEFVSFMLNWYFWVLQTNRCSLSLLCKCGSLSDLGVYMKCSDQRDPQKQCCYNFTWHQQATALTHNLCLDLKSTPGSRNKISPLVGFPGTLSAPAATDCPRLATLWASSTSSVLSSCRSGGYVLLSLNPHSFLVSVVPLRSAAARDMSHTGASTLGGACNPHRGCVMEA